MIDLNFFSHSSRDVAMAIYFRGKLANQFLFGVLAFFNGLENHNFDFKILNDNILATVYANLMKFGPVTPEIEVTD